MTGIDPKCSELFPTPLVVHTACSLLPETQSKVVSFEIQLAQGFFVTLLWGFVPYKSYYKLEILLQLTPGFFGGAG